MTSSMTPAQTARIVAPLVAGPGQQQRDAQRNNSAGVRFEIRGPKGVKGGVGTLDGNVSVDGVPSQVRARPVKGGVDAISTGGPVQASTVNGSVRAAMG